MSKFDAVIIGAGPGGLSCALALAKGGAKVMLLERKPTVGRKVCAGGITWHGLIQKVPDRLIQRTFCEQHIFSNWQKICYRRQTPVIATVNREELGLWMMENALEEQAQVRAGCNVTKISGNSLTASDRLGTFSLEFDHLVGADGSSSLVRRHLGIPVENLGVGINYQIPGNQENMEWHLNAKLFGSGYGWIFPHRDTVSIGAYACSGTTNPERLKQNLLSWAGSRGFNLTAFPAQTGFINFDYRGHRYDNKWLVGDAAGLASGLTGEGINPAIVSGEEVARKILDPSYPDDRINALIKKHGTHKKIVELASRNNFQNTLLMEALMLLLRFKVVDLQKELSM